MPTDFGTILLFALSSAGTFIVARVLSRNFRARRRERELAKRREGESRQVRRARERRAK